MKLIGCLSCSSHCVLNPNVANSKICCEHYVHFVQAFVPPEAGAHTPVMAGLCMAGTTVLVSGAAGYVLRYVGRVKLLLPVALAMTSLLLTLLLLDETQSRDSATYFAIGCVWSFCDGSLQVCFTGEFALSPSTFTINLLLLFDYEHLFNFFSALEVFDDNHAI